MTIRSGPALSDIDLSTLDFWARPRAWAPTWPVARSP